MTTRSAVFAIALVACLAGAARADVKVSVTYMNTYTVSIGGTSTLVDVYKIMLVADPGLTCGSVNMRIGTYASLGGDDPFQGGHLVSGEKYPKRYTPSQEEADMWLTPGDGTNIYEADSHMRQGIKDYSPVIDPPTETNDGSIYSVADDYLVGTGSLYVAAAIPLEFRQPVEEVGQVGVIRGQEVWLNDTSADHMGHIIEENLLIPEPATLSLLALGALAVMRRRRQAS